MINNPMEMRVPVPRLMHPNTNLKKEKGKKTLSASG